MSQVRMLFSILLSLFLVICSPCSKGLWSFELGTGVPYNFPTSLVIKQANEPDINLTARYDTDPFRSPYYYDLRIGKWTGNTAWEFEDIHHKVYLQNTTNEVQDFSISHGYNLFYLDRAWLAYHLIWRLGAGVVMAHPESTIRGLAFSQEGGTLNNGGYYLAGPSAMASVGKRFFLTNNFFIQFEGKLTTSYAWVKVAEGMAQAPNIAIHGNFGIGYNFS